MINKDSNKPFEEDPEFYKLLKATLQEDSDTFIRPDGSVIDAYVLGYASEEQKRIICKALINSSSFRREMKNITEDIAKINAMFKSEEATLLEKLKEKTNLVWNYLFPSRIPKLSIPLSIAVIVLLIISFQINYFQSREYLMTELNLISPEIEKEKLISMETRDVSTLSFKSSEDAALASIRQNISYNKNEDLFEFDLKASHQVSSDIQQEIFIQMIDDNNDILKEIVVTIPSNKKISDVETTGWILFLPSKNIHSFPIASDAIKFQWINKEMESCLTITYKEEDSYISTNGYIIKLSD